ncbi:MAG: oligosaccharide flippase family protein, partial [Pyrinomonadaceae bacterium]
MRAKLTYVTPELTVDSPGEAQKQIPSTAGMTTKVVKGSMWTLAGQVAPLAFSLVTTPFVIRMLGAEGYGVLILIGLIPGYFGFADFGMSIASTKFGSEAYAANDPEREARVVRTAAVITLVASLPVAAAIVGFSGWIVTLFNVPEHLQAEAALALKFAAVTFVVNFLNGIFNTPQLARLRMDLNTFVTSGFRIVGIVATPIVIYLGGGILGAVMVLMIASILTLAGHIYTSGRLLPRLFDLTIDRRVIRPMLNFGLTIVFALAAGMLLANLEKLLLPRFTSVEVFAYYSVAFTLATMMTLFSNAMSQSLIPAFSRLLAEKKIAHVQELYSRALRINL